MREAEFIQLLDTVEAALNPAHFADLSEERFTQVQPAAANDNDAPWSHAPFPDGWTASC